MAAHTEEAEKKNPVEWATRIKIARGTARALAYLHHGCEPRIVHRDVSSTNILLDENLEPRLSDFGLARLMENNHTHVTVTIGGTYGYIAPGNLGLTSAESCAQLLLQNPCLACFWYAVHDCYNAGFVEHDKNSLENESSF